jgi:hypothetical protein
MIEVGLDGTLNVNHTWKFGEPHLRNATIGQETFLLMSKVYTYYSERDKMRK